MLTLREEKPEDHGAIDVLLDEVFGKDRFHKASYRYRENLPAITELSWVAFQDKMLVGTIRYWPIKVEDHLSLLLGPIGIAANRKGQGIGRALIYRTLERAIELEYDLVLLVGDPPYFERFGFRPATPLGFVMPGESRPERLQVLELKDGIIKQVKGDIQHL